MRILTFILERDAFTAILAHMRKLGRPPGALPEHAASQASRPPPADGQHRLRIELRHFTARYEPV